MTQGSLPPATAEGTLDASPLAQVLAHAMEKRLAGSIVLGGAGGEPAIATIALHEGWPYKARTNEPHFLGMVLRALGIIDDNKLNASLARFAKERRPHGQILLEMGALTPNDLLRGLRAQLTEQLDGLFALPPSTRFGFYEKLDLLTGWGGPEVAPVDPLAILWPALLRSPPWPQVRTLLARIAPETPMRISPRFDLGRFRFSKKTSELLDLMRMRPLTFAQLPATQLVDETEAKLLVYAMLLTKQMVFVAPDASRSSVPAATPPPDAPRVSPASVFPHARRVSSPDLKRVSSPDLKMESAPPPARPSALPPRASAPPAGVSLTTELAAFRQRIIERVATINDEDYFEALGIPREASIPVAQAAFLALAKVWHPDRLAPQLFDVKDFGVKVFARMNDARATLTSPDLREAYILQLRRGVRPDRTAAPQETNAALEFQKAETFLRKRAYDLAAEHCRRAREAEPANADYVALLTWIAVEREGTGLVPENVHDHIEALGLALKLNDRCERAYFYRAQLFKRLNLPQKAYQDFKMVEEINPKNIDAARETHLYKKRTT